MTKFVPLPCEVKELYKIVKKLEEKHPGRKFTLDGHLVGSLGEVIAAEHFNLKLCAQSNKGFDAVDNDNNKWEIKLTQGKRVTFYHNCDNLIVLKINPPNYEEAEVIFCGNSSMLEIEKRINQNNRQVTISLNEIKKLGSN
ncbi:MAG: hypothetical protein ORO03_03585 [Alphaproteobacteria bacterium]|nr:hypothetical protein [Alphaproteobacteria bacterium]